MKNARLKKKRPKKPRDAPMPSEISAWPAKKRPLEQNLTDTLLMNSQRR